MPPTSAVFSLQVHVGLHISRETTVNAISHGSPTSWLARRRSRSARSRSLSNQRRPEQSRTAAYCSPSLQLIPRPDSSAPARFVLCSARTRSPARRHTFLLPFLHPPQLQHAHVLSHSHLLRSTCPKLGRNWPVFDIIFTATQPLTQPLTQEPLTQSLQSAFWPALRPLTALFPVPLPMLLAVPLPSACRLHFPVSHCQLVASPVASPPSPGLRIRQSHIQPRQPV